MSPNDFDITGSIKALETLKLELLQSVVDLHKSIANQRHSHDERLACLADALVRTYMLAARLGVSFEQLEEKAEDDIRVHISKEHEVLAADYAALLRYLRRRQP
ncbi:MAG: MazG-like family protein [Defluviitaleaceae bacterium]|nr:MazG-like family protein [Defluviitaleaceae bacterium]